MYCTSNHWDHYPHTPFARRGRAPSCSFNRYPPGHCHRQGSERIAVSASRLSQSASGTEKRRIADSLDCLLPDTSNYRSKTIRLFNDSGWRSGHKICQAWCLLNKAARNATLRVAADPRAHPKQKKATVLPLLRSSAVTYEFPSLFDKRRKVEAKQIEAQRMQTAVEQAKHVIDVDNRRLSTLELLDVHVQVSTVRTSNTQSEAGQ